MMGEMLENGAIFRSSVSLEICVYSEGVVSMAGFCVQLESVTSVSHMCSQTNNGFCCLVHF